MSILPFLIGPVQACMRAYESTCVDVPVSLDDKRVYKDSSSYAQAVEKLPGANIKTDLKPFFDRLGIRKDLIVKEELGSSFCSSEGTNLFTRGDAAILVAPNFYTTDKEACSWLVKRQAFHIKKNDTFMLPFVTGICTLAAAIFSTLTVSVLPATLITLCVGQIAIRIFKLYQERKADNFALADSSVEELKGGRRYLMSIRQINLDSRKSWGGKIVFSSSGEDRFDFTNPSIAGRLKKIELSLQQKGASIDEEAESIKITALKDYMVKIASSV